MASQTRNEQNFERKLDVPEQFYRFFFVQPRQRRRRRLLADKLASLQKSQRVVRRVEISLLAFHPSRKRARRFLVDAFQRLFHVSEQRFIRIYDPRSGEIAIFSLHLRANHFLFVRPFFLEKNV